VGSGGDGTLRAGVDLGGTKIQAIVVDDSYDVLGAARRPTPTTGGPPKIVAAIAEAVAEAARAAGAEPGDLAGIGVGSPGLVDARAGTVAQARNLPGWEGAFALGPALTHLLGPAVAVANDVRVATEAEFRLGAGEPYSSLLGVFWGTGVGGGLILDGEAWDGRGGAGEIGHVVVKVGGAVCGCGRRGCLEAYAGRAMMEARARRLHESGRRTELFRLMEKRGRTRLTSAVWADALKQGDKVAEELVSRAIAALGAGIASALNLLDVEAVVLGGGLGARLGPLCEGRLGEAILRHLFNDAHPPALHVTELGDLGGAKGAAMLVAQHAVEPA
jgi:glucokinase